MDIPTSSSAVNHTSTTNTERLEYGSRRTLYILQNTQRVIVQSDSM
jgi:hypothetical protein